MARQPSDFRAGVEAAAKWLQEQDCRNYRFGPYGFELNEAKELARTMLVVVGDDPEGTEARTVAQIVQYLRETAFGLIDEGDRKAVMRAANSIAAFDWKRS